jgi:histidinol-phosphate aminotransferase
MSRFFDPKLSALTPYTPGEQPKDRLLLKLNTKQLLCKLKVSTA